MTKKAQLLDVW